MTPLNYPLTLTHAGHYCTRPHHRHTQMNTETEGGREEKKGKEGG